MELIILRGLPGSGKTTHALSLGGIAFSTDRLFMVGDRYVFDRTKLAEFHLQTFQDVTLAMARRNPLVILDNTNIQVKHFLPYIVTAGAMGYKVRVQRIGALPGDQNFRDRVRMYAERNTHGVSLEKILEMASRWEAYV